MKKKKKKHKIVILNLFLFLAIKQMHMHKFFPNFHSMSQSEQTFNENVYKIHVINELMSKEQKTISQRYSFNVNSFNAVSQMQAGVDPTTALQRAMAPIIKFYPAFHGAMIAVNMDGKYGMYIKLEHVLFSENLNQNLLIQTAIVL